MNTYYVSTIDIGTYVFGNPNVMFVLSTLAASHLIMHGRVVMLKLKNFSRPSFVLSKNNHKCFCLHSLVY